MRDYLPGVPRRRSTNDVYVHQLLTHTSGIQLDMEEWVLLTAARPDRPDHDPAVRPIADVLLQLAYERPLRSTPGEMMWYDNLNYELLAEIVRRVSGQPFEDFVQERIFDPLGMIDSHAIVPEGLLGRGRAGDPGEPDGLGLGRVPADVCLRLLGVPLDRAATSPRSARHSSTVVAPAPDAFWAPPPCGR